MGQRHQAFLIARVRPHGSPPNYPGQRRCIAAVYHQWCFDQAPLEAARRFVNLINNSENLSVVRAELRALEGQYGPHGEEEPCIPNYPCPYTASLLGSAWTTDLAAGRRMYASGLTLEHNIMPAWVGCWGDADNDDGITILDITEPDRPAYCFLRDERVLDARGYLGFSLDGDEAVKGLESVPLIAADVLAEAWPQFCFADPAASKARPFPRTVSATVADAAAVPPLVDMILDVAVKHSIHNDDDNEIERLMRLPGKAPEIKSILRGVNPFPDSGVRLLIRTLSELEEVARVDLSNFQLSGPQLAQVLSAVGEIELLDASSNSVLVADDIPTLLEAAPTLRRLVVMDCPSIVDRKILDLVQEEPTHFRTLEGLLHPAFLTIEKPLSYPSAFTFVAIDDNGDLSCTSIPFFTPAQAVQALTDILPWRDPHEFGCNGAHTKPLASLSAFHVGLRKSGQTFGERTVVSVPLLSSRIPRDQQDLWVFVLRAPERDSSWSFNKRPIKNRWGFVRYIKAEEGRPTDGPPLTDADTTRAKSILNKQLGCSGRVYDLQGFLECMAREGRPMPSEEAAQELERLLYQKVMETGEFCCPFMDLEDAVEIEPTGVFARETGERYR
ncbi:hypothetical protein DICSQDRAFT_103597 [Dichomitus squalens LYAD-421 SS1]|uniref:uncharacterized protein n=1 Tax=Dichomitus squalens (strain LYAD-421) TaxID=732165 RepID=UPI0004413D9B|nr:uncharacterized protein DICSQDRAFT_103597 [Dichomitus squalens LYAD-421 SS1]EJF63079.1 hypothetical protein DICSQDRAFT_103597 [Dichomitus squalens LYAD-421 SS1]